MSSPGKGNPAKKSEESKKSLFSGVNIFGKPKTEKQLDAARKRREQKARKAEERRKRQEEEVKERNAKRAAKKEERAKIQEEKRLERKRKKQERLQREAQAKKDYQAKNAVNQSDKQKGMFVAGNSQEIGGGGVAKNIAGSVLRLFGRATATLAGAGVYSAVMVGVYALGGPIGGAVVGGITGFYAALKANKSHGQANPNEGMFKRFARATARVLTMTAAGAAVGALPPPGNLVGIGPAIVAADKVCSIGAHPKKGMIRDMGDVFGAMIPGAGIYQYAEKRNVELASGRAIQSSSAKVSPAPPAARPLDLPARGHDRARGVAAPSAPPVSRGEDKTVPSVADPAAGDVPVGVPVADPVPAGPEVHSGRDHPPREGAVSTSTTKVGEPAPPSYETLFPDGPPAEIKKGGSSVAPPASPGSTVSSGKKRSGRGG